MHRRTLVAASLTLPLSLVPGRARAAPSASSVLELFTSQGCSSCPPADALLGELTRQPGVIGLAWHVDYWNSSAWRDPYAKREWTDRQKAYARYLSGEVFTPALVVNGTALTVGSDAPAVRRVMAQLPPPPLAVALRRAADGGGLEAEIGATTTPVGAMLVTYDPARTTQVNGGENLGSRLMEYRVVQTAIPVERLAARFTLPPVPEGRGAVLLVQDANWRVMGAADLPPSAAR